MSAAHVMVCSISAAMLLLACSGADGSVFGNGGPGDNGNAAVGGPTGSFGSSNDPVGTNAACVTATKNAALPAVNIILMYDKSGSMGDPAEGGDPTLKWIPVNSGMKAFFTDPASSGYNASLQFFPAPGDINTTCNFPYATPDVPLTPLASSQPLISALDSTSPQGGTPTLPALQGAIAYANATIAARPEETTVVVLVTDGEPGLMVNGQFQPGCTNNDIPHVAAAASAAFQTSPSVATFVIGVGPALANLNAIASAGGTNQAFMVPVSNPADTKTQLQQALESVRSQVKLACDFPLPAAPAGQSIDVYRVNVAFTSGAGQEQPLVYSNDCSVPNGWHYDNINAPTRIVLCPSSCGSAQSDRNGKLTIAFGCTTNGLQK